jgi:hypothetical protein
MQGAACSCRWECCGVRRRRGQLFTASTGQAVQRLAGFGKYWSWTREDGPPSATLLACAEVIEVIDLILDFTVPPHQIRRLWRHQGLIRRASMASIRRTRTRLIAS